MGLAVGDLIRNGAYERDPEPERTIEDRLDRIITLLELLLYAVKEKP